MNSIVTQVHDALRNYRSLLTHDIAKRGHSLVKKNEDKALQDVDLIHFSKEAFDELTAMKEGVNTMETLLSYKPKQAIQEKKVGLLEDRVI